MTSASDSWVLITGASSGIGQELAVIYLEKGYRLYLVARRAERLRLIARSPSEAKRIRIISEDLSDPASYQRIYQHTQDDGAVIDTLINNAGLGYMGLFEKCSPERNDHMLRVNIDALTMLTQLFLPGMIARRKGKILQMGSLGGFQPGPLVSSYYATKSYVFSYAQALSEEVHKYGIQISVLCPGPTESEFWKDFSGGRAPLKAQSAQIVAQRAYRAFHRGTRIILTASSHKWVLLLNRLLPRSLVTHAVGKMMQKRIQAQKALT